MMAEDQAYPLIATAPPSTNDGATVAPDGAHAPRRSWLDGFRRITTSGEFIPEIDGLRFIAIALVIAHHLALFISIQRGQSEGSLSHGQLGVELFFVISGFILAVPFAMQYLGAGRPVSLRRYFVRRLTRLEPPYLIALLLLTLMRVLLRHEQIEIIWWNLLFSAFYVHGFMKGLGSQILGVAWSLEIEVQFYLLMPLLGFVFLINNRWFRRAVLVIPMLACAIATGLHPISIRGIFVDPRNAPYLDRHLLNYIQYFLAGLLLADVYVTEWRAAPPPVRAAKIAWGDFVWLIGWPAMFSVVAYCGIAGRALLPAMIFLLYLSLFYAGLARRLMRVRLLTVIGGMCYSIYLLHNSVIQVVGPWVHGLLPQNYPAAVALFALIIIPQILIFCGLYFRAIERPCMRPDWPTRLWKWFTNRLFIEDQEPSQTR